MSLPTTDRRTFLRAFSALGLSAPVLARLERDTARFEADLQAIDFDGSDRSSRDLRGAYLLERGVLYLNHASIGTVPRPVHRAHVGYLELCETNPWLYMWGGAWEEPREAVRARLAGVLGCEPGDTAITHNTTEGFNLLAGGLGLGPGDEVLFSNLNHDGASVCWEHAAETAGFGVRRFSFPFEDAAALSSDDVARLYLEQIRPQTRVLVFPHIDNVVGLRHPLAALARGAHERGVEVVAVDGAQAAGMIPLDVGGSGVDAYASSPHKWLQAPKGLGVLYLRPFLRERLRPMWVTWGQDRWTGTVRRFEDYGTRNLPEVMALSDAVAFQRALGPDAKVRRYRDLRARALAKVDASSRLRWRSPRTWEAGGSLIAIEVAAPATEVLANLRTRGLVARAFGPPTNSIRLSPNASTTDAELERAIDLLEGA